MTEQKTLADFIAEHGLTMSASYQGRFTNDATASSDDRKWDHFAWRVTIANGKRNYSTDYRMGIAHQHWDRKGAPIHDLPRGEKWGEQVSQRIIGGRGLTVFDVECRDRYAKPTPPSLEDVLDSLRSDAESVENNPLFDDWAGDMGYDTDSRKAEKVFHACQEVRGQLIKLLGQTAYNDLLESVERL